MILFNTFKTIKLRWLFVTVRYFIFIFIVFIQIPFLRGFGDGDLSNESKFGIINRGLSVAFFKQFCIWSWIIILSLSSAEYELKMSRKNWNPNWHFNIPLIRFDSWNFISAVTLSVSTIEMILLTYFWKLSSARWGSSVGCCWAQETFTFFWIH